MSPPATVSVDQARVDILDAADALFYERGISAVRVSDIRDLSGVSLRRLYALYPHKTDLVTGWLEHRHTSWMEMFSAGIDSRLADGAAPIDAVFGSLANWLTSTRFRGCGFINALAETGEVTDEHRRIIRDHKQQLIRMLDQYADHPAALAVLIDGAIVQAAIFQSTGPVDAALAVATTFFSHTTR